MECTPFIIAVIGAIVFMLVVVFMLCDNRVFKHRTYKEGYELAKELLDDER